MACLQIYRELLSLATFLRVHSNSKEVSYLSWQNTYPNLKTTCHIKLKFFLWTKVLQNLLLAKYLISVAAPLIDHILTAFPERVSQQGIIDVGLSDHELIYCTRKFSRTKVGTHKQITFCSLKNYTAEAYKEALSKVYFPNYEKFTDMHKAYENFIQKLMSVIDKLAPFKTKRVKGNSQECFAWEFLESIALRDQLFKKFKSSKLNLDKEIYNKARNKSHRLILRKKKQSTSKTN